MLYSGQCGSRRRGRKFLQIQSFGATSRTIGNDVSMCHVSSPSRQNNHGFDLSTYVKSGNESIGTDRLADSFEQLFHNARSAYRDENNEFCSRILKSSIQIRSKQDDLAKAADRYSGNGSADRDFTWEQNFAREWVELSYKARGIGKHVIKCDEFKKMVHRVYGVENIVFHKSVKHVLRLAESGETIRNETRQQTGEDDSTNRTDVLINRASNRASHSTSESQSNAVENVPANGPERKALEDRNGSAMQNGIDTSSSSSETALNGFVEPKTLDTIHNPKSKLNSTQGPVVRKDNEDNRSPPSVSKKPVVGQKQSNSMEFVEALENDTKSTRTKTKDSNARSPNPTLPTKQSGKLETSMAGGKVEKEEANKNDLKVEDD